MADLEHEVGTGHSPCVSGGQRGTTDTPEAEGAPLDDGDLGELVQAVLERLLLPIVEAAEKRLELPPREWFSIAATEALTGMSADYIRRHVTTGVLPVSNMGTFEKPCYRIHRKDIDEWMARRQEAPQPAPRKKKAQVGSYVSRHHKHQAA